jgi:uncharacterized protein DUF6640
MTGKEKIAAALLTLTAIVYAVVPPIVDINPTHILNPEWTTHARFHTVWQVSVNSMLGLLSVLLVWWPGASRPLRIKIGAVLGCIALGGFFVAALTRHLYGGALSDPNGVPPVAGMDANLLLFTPTSLVQVATLLFVLFPERRSR